MDRNKSPRVVSVDMEFDEKTTVAVFVAVVAVAVAGSAFSPMSTDTVLMMVLPTAVVYGAVMLALGVKHGMYRAGR